VKPTGVTVAGAIGLAVQLAACGSDSSPVPSGAPITKDAGTPETTPPRDDAATDGHASSDGASGDGGVRDAGSHDCALPNYPTPDCTGAPPGLALTTHEGDLVIEDPGVYENLHVTGHVFICSSDVTLRNSVVNGLGDGMAINTRDYPCDSRLRENVLVEDVTIEPTDFDLPATDWAMYESDGPLGNERWPEIAIGPSGFTCRRCKIITRDGPRAGTALEGPDVTSANIRIEDSYIFARSDGHEEPCNHTDGIQGYYGGANVVLEHVTIDSGTACATGAIFAGDESTSMEVYDSLLMGGGYTITLGDDPGLVADYKVRDVKIVDGSWGYEPARCPGAQHLKLWSDVDVVKIDPVYRVTSTVRNLPSCE